jgi:hypothetical protein
MGLKKCTKCTDVSEAHLHTLNKGSGCRFLETLVHTRLQSVTSQKCYVRMISRFETTPRWLLVHNLHSHTLPWGAVCRSWTLKSRPARSCRNCALSMPRTHSGNRNRWSIPSWGPCCWRCLLVAVGVALDAVSILLNKAHLTRTDENRTHPRVPSLHGHQHRLRASCRQPEPRNQFRGPTLADASRHGCRGRGSGGIRDNKNCY